MRAVAATSDCWRSPLHADSTSHSHNMLSFHYNNNEHRLSLRPKNTLVIIRVVKKWRRATLNTLGQRRIQKCWKEVEGGGRWQCMRPAIHLPQLHTMNWTRVIPENATYWKIADTYRGRPPHAPPPSFESQWWTMKGKVKFGARPYKVTICDLWVHCVSAWNSAYHGKQ